MKIKLKERSKLYEEGWQMLGRYLSFGNSKADWTARLCWFDEQLLGKEVELLNYDLEDKEPKVHVKLGARTTWIPFQIVETKLGVNDFFPKEKTKIGRHKIQYIKHLEQFEVGCEDLSEAVALKMAQWMLPKIGYKVVKNEKRKSKKAR